MLQDFDFDFSGFEDVPPPQPRATYRLTFTEEDRLSQNDSFHRVLQGACAFRLQLSPDGRFIRLDPKGTPQSDLLEGGHPHASSAWRYAPPERDGAAAVLRPVLAGGSRLLGGAV